MPFISHSQVRGHRAGSDHSGHVEWRNTPGKNKTNLLVCSCVGEGDVLVQGSGSQRRNASTRISLYQVRIIAAAGFVLPFPFFLFFFHAPTFQFWTSRGYRCRPFFPPVLAFNFIAHRVQQSHCSSISRRELLTHALALSASQFVHKKKSHRNYTSMHSAGLEVTKLTYTRLQDNLIPGTPPGRYTMRLQQWSSNVDRR